MIETPRIKVLVKNTYLGLKDDGLTQAYLMAVDCRMSSYIRFTVYLETGALWSSLPIEAIYCDKFGEVDLTKESSTEDLQPYSCLEGPISIVEYTLVKNASVDTKTLGAGNYLFTINYEGVGISEDPEQYKSHNIVCLESGQLCALPNNYIRFKDNWFAQHNNEKLEYKRSKTYYFPGG